MLFSLLTKIRDIAIDRSLAVVSTVRCWLKAQQQSAHDVISCDTALAFLRQQVATLRGAGFVAIKQAEVICYSSVQQLESRSSFFLKSIRFMVLC